MTSKGPLLAFIDLLLCMVGLFIFLWIVDHLQVHKKTPPVDANIVVKAEFVLSLDWPGKSFDDIDLYVLLPNKKVVYFNSKDQNGVNLERDDLGGRSDIVYVDGKPHHVLEVNKELVMFRGYEPGRYVVNVHVFRANDKIEIAQQLGTNPMPLPYDAKVEFMRLNPRVEVLASKTVALDHQGQQVTAFAFTIFPDGRVTVENDADQPFIQTADQSVSGDR